MRRMITGKAARCALVAGSLLAGCATVATPEPPGGRDESSRLAGTRYGWTLSGRAAQNAQYREEWSFGADGVMTVVSGQETTTKRYALETVPGESMLALSMIRLTTNGQPDCMGDVDATVGQRRQIYLQFLNGGGFFTCGATDGLSCYGVASPR